MRVQNESKDRPRRLPAALLGLVGTAAAAALLLALAPSAQAQFWSPFGFGAPRRPPGAIPQQQQQQQQYNQQYNPFGGFFGQPEQHREAPVDYSHAPAPQARHGDTQPTTPVVVLGDAMADWLASGLEDAFADDADVSIVRKPRFNAGLIRFDPRKENDWPQTIREVIAQEKPRFIVMMIGTNDHQQIRDRVVPAGKPAGNSPPAKPGAQPAAQPAAVPAGGELALSGEDPPPNPDQDQPAQAAPAGSPSGPLEFHTDQWEAAYIKRIDAAIAAMKSGGVPVIWVGLPAQRGPKATADSSYLNDLYRGRAERAGVIYVDVWDGFVDEQGRYSPQGPDFEGQTRRLRSGDGVYFTKAGARKLAHYVEREIERSIANRAVPVALPVEPTTPGGKAVPGSSTRPLVGPVIPLTVSTSGADELVGGARPAARQATPDPLAARALTKGEQLPAPSGRADDFSWPHGGGSATAVNTDPSSQPAVTTTGLTTVPDPPASGATTTPTTTSKGGKPAAAPASASQRTDLDGATKKPPQRAQDTPPRPPAGIGPFGLFR